MPREDDNKFNADWPSTEGWQNMSKKNELFKSRAHQHQRSPIRSHHTSNLVRG
jgi:hypothetical protein